MGCSCRNWYGIINPGISVTSSVNYYSPVPSRKFDAPRRIYAFYVELPVAQSPPIEQTKIRFLWTAVLASSE